MNLFNKNVHRTISIFVFLALCVGLCLEAAAFPPDVMAVGELHQLEGGYSITAAEANAEEGTARFRLLYQEVEIIDEKDVNRGERFHLNDGDKFHFEATLESVFCSDYTTMVHLIDYDWWGEPEPEIPSPPAQTPTPEPYFAFYPIIVLVCCIAIGLPIIFIIYRYGKRPSGGQNEQKPPESGDYTQKIGEYHAKIKEWEEEGYDVSELKKEFERKK